MVKKDEPPPLSTLADVAKDAYPSFFALFLVSYPVGN